MTIRLIPGDCRSVLATLPADSVAASELAQRAFAVGDTVTAIAALRLAVQLVQLAKLQA